tara:strand:- start:3065 stop:3577 length:513 start_codon:yes stop_codon:yes gene_type:complete
MKLLKIMSFFTSLTLVLVLMLPTSASAGIITFDWDLNDTSADFRIVNNEMDFWLNRINFNNTEAVDLWVIGRGNTNLSLELFDINDMTLGSVFIDSDYFGSVMVKSFNPGGYAHFSGRGGRFLSAQYEFRASATPIAPDVTEVPSPSSYTLFLVGLGLVGFMAVRRKQTI